MNTSRSMLTGGKWLLLLLAAVGSACIGRSGTKSGHYSVHSRMEPGDNFKQSAGTEAEKEWIYGVWRLDRARDNYDTLQFELRRPEVGKVYTLPSEDARAIYMSLRIYDEFFVVPANRITGTIEVIGTDDTDLHLTLDLTMRGVRWDYKTDPPTEEPQTRTLKEEQWFWFGGIWPFTTPVSSRHR